MKHLLTLALFAALLAGCGTTTGGQGNPAATVVPAATATPAAQTADEVHAAWTAALRDNDRQAAMVLVAPETQRYVDNAQAIIQKLITTPPKLYGSFAGVDVLPVTDQGAGRVGVSRFRFAQDDECYQTSLAQVEGAWRVVNWGIVPCP